ncbi:RNA-directed DNA polymerase [Massilia sp. W12]|uniref:RNA-directed DNA polymerase n=1 Tax=Massilia sp. W12 TaxID=3126507 RepID=UPI0030CF5CAE
MIQKEITSGSGVSVVIMDISSYYHNIDPSFFGKEIFWDSCGINLTSWEKQFTREFSKFLVHWSNLAGENILADNNIEFKGGLPMGLSISRIISNLQLLKFDSEVEEELNPAYYGRYVDDIFW